MDISIKSKQRIDHNSQTFMFCVYSCSINSTFFFLIGQTKEQSEFNLKFQLSITYFF